MVQWSSNSIGASRSASGWLETPRDIHEEDGAAVRVRDGESRYSHDGAGDKGEGEPHPEFLIPLASKTTDDAVTQRQSKTNPTGPRKRQDRSIFHSGRSGPVPSGLEQPGP